MTSPLRTQNPLAERRFAYAQAAARDGDFAAAAEVFEQALELDPAWATAWFALAAARQRQGNFPAARAAFARSVDLDPTDAQGASVRIAALDGVAPKTLPAAYMARLFDDYAPRFDAHLTEDLRYRGPLLLAQAIQAAAPGRRFASAIDLGCGSGLMAAPLRARVETLVGVDLSPGMIEEARKTGLYDALEVGDVVDFLEGQTAADLIVAADVFVYLGDLAPTFAAAAQALTSDGLFAFSVESERGEGFGLGETLRYSHSRAYLLATLAGAALEAVYLREASIRREAGTAVPGLIVIAQLGRE